MKTERNTLSKIITKAITKEDWKEYQVKKRHLLTEVEFEIEKEFAKWEKVYKENYIRKDALPDLFRISDKILGILESNDIEAIKNFKKMINNVKETNNE